MWPSPQGECSKKQMPTCGAQTTSGVRLPAQQMSDTMTPAQQAVDPGTHRHSLMLQSHEAVKSWSERHICRLDTASLCPANAPSWRPGPGA